MAKVESRSWWVWLAACAFMICSAGTAWAAPKAPATLVASVDGVEPGQTFAVGIAYELAEGWHIYWKNPGDSGAPPRIDWKLPGGFEAGSLQFPAPQRLEAGPPEFQIVTYVHEGEPVLVAELSAPDDLEVGSTITLAAKLDSLVCKETCIPESQDLSLTLPVVAKGSAKPANEEIFKRAERQAPKSGGKGKHITVRASTTTDAPKAGAKFDLRIRAKVAPGHHIQSNKPFDDRLIATQVIPASIPGLEFGQPKFPEPHVSVDANKVRVSEFRDEIEIRIPVEVTADFKGIAGELDGVLISQACKDGGNCYRPETVAWSTGLGDGAVADTGEADDGAETAIAGGTESGVEAGGGGEDVSNATGASNTQVALPTFWAMMGLAFVGGLILNIMPCVLPVISIKILSFVKQADDDPKRVLRLGITFALGIVVSFWLLGGAVLITKAATGKGLAWGQQFSNPIFLVVMTSIVFAFGLSLFGVFEVLLPGSAATKLSSAGEREGYPGAFFKGVLATLLATPCTAPFLAPAMAAAFAQSGTIIMLGLTSVGLGMAFPYVLLTAKPAWMKYLPRPGAWMEGFKQFMGFVLMGTVVWLLWIIAGVRGAEFVMATLTFLTFLGLACWIYGRISLTWAFGPKLRAMLSAAGVLAIGMWFSFMYMLAAQTAITWVDYKPGLAKRLSEEGYTVYVDYTAIWCATCQVNKAAVLHTDPIEKEFNDLNVVAIKADFSDGSSEIEADLKAYGRDAVPLNIILPAGQPDKPIVLPVILTRGIVLDGLHEAGPSSNTAPYKSIGLASNLMAGGQTN